MKFPLNRTKVQTKHVASLLKVQLNDSHISISHRLPKTKTTNNDQVHYNNAKVLSPSNVCFSNRDKRNELYRKRKLLKTTRKTNQSPVTIQENLTSLRKFLLNDARKAKEYLNFNYIWTSNGKILLRQHPTSKIISVSSIKDLARLRYRSPSNYVSESAEKTKVNNYIY